MTSLQSAGGHSGRRFPMRTVVGLLVMVLGAACLLYPIVAQWRSSISERHMSNEYLEQSQRIAASRRADLLQTARAYNDRVFQGLTPRANISDESFRSDDDYMHQLSVGGMMATVLIPKISVQLPIYHGTDEATLTVGAGHLYGTSLPIGGKGTNSVIAGHRGLPGALLFTRLNELDKGDTFVIDVLGERHWYRVDAVWVVDPDDTSHFGIERGKEYVTLLTCTPYGINTQRLLVRGVRCAAPDSRQTDTGLYPSVAYALVVSAVTGVFLGVVLALRRRAMTMPVSRHAALYR